MLDRAPINSAMLLLTVAVVNMWSMSGGIMTLTDVYCVFNRARGTELVSPDDLLAACKLLSTLGLPLRLRSFPSGVTVRRLCP